MTLTICGKRFERIAVVDDTEESRETTAEIVADANLEPVLVKQPLHSIGDLLTFMKKTRSEAAILDHRLSLGNLAQFTGAMAAAELYRNQIPALLVTTYSKADIVEIRKHRSAIPVLASHLEADDVQPSVEKCMKEFQQQYDIERRPTRTIVRVADIERNSNPQTAYLVVTSWDADQKIALPLDAFPVHLRQSLATGQRLAATVNTGASSMDDLYLRDLQLLDDLKDRYANLKRT